MAEISRDHYQGFLLPGFTYADLQDKGGGATESAYNEAGPRVGVPVASRADGLTLEASGSQKADASIEVTAHRAGAPGAGEGGFTWRNLAQGETDECGWDPFQVITGWEAIIADSTGTPWVTLYVHGIQLANGEALFLTAQSKTTDEIRLDRYDPIAEEWSTVTGPDLGYEVAGGCLMQLPDGVVLLFVESRSTEQIDVYQSADDGDTWTVYARGALATPLSNTNAKAIIRAAYSDGEVCLVVKDTSGADAWWQYASDSEGARFTLVDATWDVASSNIDGCDLIGLPSGGFAMSYYDSDGTPEWAARRIVSAFDAFADADSSTLVASASATIPTSALWLDEDGALYVALNDDGATAGVTFKRSTDDAATWANYPTDAATPITDNNSIELNKYGVALVGGRLALLTRWTASGSSFDPYSVGCIWLGGYGRHTVPSASTGKFDDASRIAYAYNAGSSTNGGQWLPFGVPGTSWSTSGPGTLTQNADLTATASGVTATTWETTATATDVFAELILKATANDGYLELRLVDDPASASSLYRVTMSLTSGGTLQVYDENAAAVVGTNVTGLSADTWYRIRVALDDGGNVRTWYATEAQVTHWQEGPSGTGLTSSASNVNNRVIFGTGTSADVDFKFCGFCFWPERWSSETFGRIGAEWSNPESLHPRSIPTSPTFVHEGLHVRGLNGIAHKGDTWRIGTRYDHPISDAFPDVSPSPAAVWRSSNTDAVELVLGRETVNFSANSHTSYEDSVAIGAVVLGANFKTFYLEGYDGSSWDTLATADASDGLTGLGFTRNGSKVRPAAGTSTAARRLLMHDHVGDVFDLGSGDPEHRYCRISANTGGTWTEDTAHTPVVTLEDPTSSAVGSGTGAIWVRNFGVVVHDHLGTYEYFRIRIPSQDTPDDDFRGKIVVGPVHVLGQQYDNGWSVTKDRPFRETTLPNGRRRRKPIGPVRRSIDFGWTTTALDATGTYLDQTTAVADYVVPGATAPAATPSAVVSFMEGLVELAGGEPLVLLRYVPTGGSVEKVNVREGLVYGRFEGDIARDNVTGTEVTDPLDRLGPLRFVEEV